MAARNDLLKELLKARADVEAMIVSYIEQKEQPSSEVDWFDFPDHLNTEDNNDKGNDFTGIASAE